MYVFTSQQSCLLDLSANIWRRRGAAKRFGLNFNEETATEVLLLDIAGQFPGYVTIIPFTHSWESRIGADWAWAFVGPDGGSCQGMLVQAKRLDDRDREYRELFRRSGQGVAGTAKSQIDLLIENAGRFGLPPVYAFYNHLSDPTRVPTDSCGSLGMVPQRLPESWGVAIASAFAVRDAGPDKTYDRHRRHCRPLHCLLCSGGSGRQGPMGSAGAAAAALSELFGDAGDDEGPGSDGVPSFEPTDEWPELFRYAEELHRMRTIGEERRPFDLRGKFRGIAGVAIMRDSKDEETVPDGSPRRQ